MATNTNANVLFTRIKSISNHIQASSCASSESECACCNQKVVRVCVTGAAGQIAYTLLPQICSGRMFGTETQVILHLLDIPPMAKALTGVAMELDDCAFPLLVGLIATVDPQTAFNQVDAAVLVGAFPRRKGMERKDLLEKNAKIFEDQGKVIDQFASPNVKIVVVGNPANTNALILKHNAPNIPPENFSALTRLDHNRAKSQIAKKIDVPVANIRNVVIWGNHSSTQYPDISYAFVDRPNERMTLSAAATINDKQWVQNTFIPTVQQRGAAVIKARGLSSAASAANAIVEHMHDWWLGTKKGEIVSMAVCSDGSYGIPEGLMFSFPVTCQPGGQYKIVQGLKLSAFSQDKIDATTKELMQERDTALSFLAAQNNA